MKDSCIVLEGGGLRGAFTSGVLEYLLEKEINFDRVVGVSAGACVGASYLSKQKGRNRKVNVEYPSDKRYMGFRHLFTTGSYFNMKFVFGELPGKLVPFDEGAFFENPSEFDVVTTSLITGDSVVFSKREIAKIGIDKVLIASSSIPLLSQPTAIGDQLFFDGGVSDSIPVKYALGKHEKAVVVLTQPRGYRKGKPGNTLLLKLVFRNTPDFCKPCFGEMKYMMPCWISADRWSGKENYLLSPPRLNSPSDVPKRALKTDGPVQPRLYVYWQGCSKIFSCF